MIPSKELASLVGFLALILGYFKIDIGEGELQTLLGAVLVAYGIIKNWVEKYKNGTISLGGFKK